MDAGATRYTTLAGTVELRQAIADKLARENGIAYDICEIIVTNGAKSAIYAARRDARRRRRGDHAGALLGLLSGHGARLRRRAGAGRLPGGAGVQADAGGARGCDHAADALAGPQLALEPDRRDLHRRTSTARWPRCLSATRTSW